MLLTISTSFATIVYSDPDSSKPASLLWIFRVLLFPASKMSGLSKTLSLRSPESKSEWWTEALEQRSLAAALIPMCLRRDCDRDQRKNRVLWNILFTVKLCHFLPWGHIQRWVADDASKHHDSALSLQSAEKKKLLAPPAESVNEPPAVGNQSGLAGGEAAENERDRASFLQCRSLWGDTLQTLSACWHHPFPTKRQQGRRGDRGGSMYFLCRYSVVQLLKERHFCYIFNVESENGC